MGKSRGNLLIIEKSCKYLFIRLVYKKGNALFILGSCTFSGFSVKVFQNNFYFFFNKDNFFFIPKLKLFTKYNKFFKNLIKGLMFEYFFFIELSGRGYKLFFKKSLNLEIKIGMSHKIIFPLSLGLSIKRLSVGLYYLLSIDVMKLKQVVYQLKQLKKIDKYKGYGFNVQN